MIYEQTVNIFYRTVDRSCEAKTAEISAAGRRLSQVKICRGGIFISENLCENSKNMVKYNSNVWLAGVIPVANRESRVFLMELSNSKRENDENIHQNKSRIS